MGLFRNQKDYTKITWSIDYSSEVKDLGGIVDVSLGHSGYTYEKPHTVEVRYLPAFIELFEKINSLEGVTAELYEVEPKKRLV